MQEQQLQPKSAPPPVRKPNSERPGYFPLFIGTNNTGKTTLAKKLIEAELKKPAGRALILTPDYTEWQNIEEVHPNFPERIQRYTGARKLIVTRGNAYEILECIRENFTSGVLLFDDCRAYLKSRTSDVLEAILVRRRMMMIDVIAVGHSPIKIPPAFFGYCTHICLFKTIGSMNVRKDELEEIDRWLTIQQAVNRQAETDIHYYEIHKV